MTDLDLFKSEWKFTRGLTLELLDSLTDAELAETPNPDVGPFWKQFRHVGRLQECFQEALNRRKIRFDYQNKRYRGGCSKKCFEGLSSSSGPRTGAGCGASRLECDHRVGKWNDLYLSALDAYACSRDPPSRSVGSSMRGLLKKQLPLGWKAWGV